MAYIWINPVTESMYEPDILDEFLCEHGYRRIKTVTDWLSIVKEKYRLAVEQATNTVMDMRCPKTKELLEEAGVISDVTIPKINPILIHCAKECSEREDLQNQTKIITTPCQSLADMGNSLNLKDTWFVPWNSVIDSIGREPERKEPKESPIPPGFFDELEIKTFSITGEEELRNYLSNYTPNEVQLVEMLFCKEGCHNGDGIRAGEQ